MTTSGPLKAETLQELNELVAINIDSTRGLKHVAEQTEAPVLRRVFSSIAENRSKFANQLDRFVRATGDVPPTGGFPMSSIHRWWTGARSLLANDSTQSLLEEAERGEYSIKTAYESALKKTVGTPAHELLQQQYAKVKAGHDVIRIIRDSGRHKN